MNIKGQMKRSIGQRIARCFHGALLLATSTLVTLATAESVTPTAAQGPPMIKELLAGRAAPALADDLKLFGQFVGDWDIRSETYFPDRTKQNKGSLHVGWILYGTALQDVWTTDKEDAPPGYPMKSFGTTIRFFDQKAKIWQVVWIAPVERVVQIFTAHESAGEIVLEGHTPAGGMERWIWSNYTPNAFEWRSTESSDNGKTWKLTQRIWGKRQTDHGEPSSKSK
jgi:hypothetical protein